MWTAEAEKRGRLCPRFHKAWIMLGGQHQQSTNAAQPTFTQAASSLPNTLLLFFHFSLLRMSSGKDDESLKTSWLQKHTFFSLTLNQMSNLGLWKQHRHEKQRWLIAILRAYYEASPLSAMEVKRLERLGDRSFRECKWSQRSPFNYIYTYAH